MAKYTDSVTYSQALLVLQAVSEDYSHDGESGALSAPAAEVLQAVWTQLRELTPEVPERI